MVASACSAKTIEEALYLLPFWARLRSAAETIGKTLDLLRFPFDRDRDRDRDRHRDRDDAQRDILAYHRRPEVAIRLVSESLVPAVNLDPEDG